MYKNLTHRSLRQHPHGYDSIARTKLNAINKDVMSELGEVVTEIYSNKDIRQCHHHRFRVRRLFVAGR